MLTHQNETKKCETLTNHRIPYLTYRSQIGTNNTPRNSNHKYHQPYPKVRTLNSNKQTKNLADDDKHNPQTKLHHSRNVKCYDTDCVVKCEGVNLFIHNNNGYVIVSLNWYKYRPLKVEFIVLLWFRIPDNPVCMSNVTCILHDQAIHLPSFLL